MLWRRKMRRGGSPIFLIRKGSSNKFPWELSRNHTLTGVAEKSNSCLTTAEKERL